MPKHSLRKIVSFLNNPEEDGGFWLPNIQRAFVWQEEQICRLFDSIMRQYPISTLLIWKTKSEIRHRKFIDNYRSDSRITDSYVSPNNNKKCLVLDGQQRLQSLYIGLKGSYDGKELYFNILSGDLIAPDDVKYFFAFKDTENVNFPWIKFRNIVFGSADYYTATENLIDTIDVELSPEKKEKVRKNIAVVIQTFNSDDGISYQELDSIENEELYSEDDVVEIFIRANSGGTILGKSDLLYSLLLSNWEKADEEMEYLISTINSHGFQFSRDFVLKTCLTLLNQGARYEVSKFRKQGIREEIEEKWVEINDAIKEVVDFVEGNTFIKCHKALPSYLVLIPLIYMRFHYKEKWRSVQNLENYLLRALISGSFSGNPDKLIDDCTAKINEEETFNVDQIFGVIRSLGRSLELTENRFWKMGYGSNTIYILFNLWYKNFNFTPGYNNNLPQVDHIFPQSALRKVKDINPDTGRRNIMRYPAYTRDQLANCMLLSQEENGAGGKSDTVPEDWFSDKSEEYLNMHLIPQDSNLWKMENFEDFIVERKKLLQDKFSFLLVSEE